MKKLLLVGITALALAACNNAAEGVEDKQDSIDSALNAQKDVIDSIAEERKETIDTIMDRKIDSLENIDSAR